jgi:hypothetical protein
MTFFLLCRSPGLRSLDVEIRVRIRRSKTDQEGVGDFVSIPHGSRLRPVAVSLAIYAGLYNIAADVPHTQPLYWLIETVRNQSVAVRARDVIVPNDLDDTNRISRGAGQYAEMCSSCSCAWHETDGDQPRPIPSGTRAAALNRAYACRAVLDHQARHKDDRDASLGVTHDDELLWDVVAFVRKVPELTPEQYQTLLKNAPKHEEIMHNMEMDGDHQHGAHEH